MIFRKTILKCTYEAVTQRGNSWVFVLSLFSYIFPAIGWTQSGVETPLELNASPRIGFYTEMGGAKENLSQELFRPASVSKILTAYTALKKLGPNFQFKTEVSWKVSQKEPLTIHSLEFRGWADPTFGVEDFGEVNPNLRLIKLAAVLREKGIKRVQGDIIFSSASPDLNRRENLILPTGWIIDDYRACYGLSAIPSPINYRENCGLFTVTDLKTGKWDLPSLKREIPSELIYGSENKITLVWDNEKKIHKLTGTYLKNSSPRFIPVPLTEADTRQIIQREWENALADSEIAFSAEKPVRNEPEETDGITLFSPPLKEVIKPFLKSSLNFIGENIILALGLSEAPTDGLSTYDRGLNLVKKIHLSITNIGAGKEVIHDGCGLSRLSLLTPETTFNFLIHLQKDSELFPYILDALPVSGTDGTLKERFKEPSLLGKVLAKTGSLDGVSNLAGFFRDPLLNPFEWKPFVIFAQSATNFSPRPAVDLTLRSWFGLTNSIETSPSRHTLERVKSPEGSRYE
jgi:serine-type D-Ala-D-Ala carboxypeptidase/endopeptidase (penicillin-binding protein 4)